MIIKEERVRGDLIRIKDFFSGGGQSCVGVMLWGSLAEDEEKGNG